MAENKLRIILYLIKYVSLKKLYLNQLSIYLCIDRHKLGIL